MKAHTFRSITAFAIARFPALLVFGCIAILSGTAQATSSPGQSGTTLRDNANGCLGCHGAQNTALNVTITGPTAVLPGATVQYTISVNGFPAGLNAGFNAAVTLVAPQATFSQGAGETMFTSGGATEIVHGQKKPNPASFVVNLTMPGTAVLGTTRTLYVTANAGVPLAFGWDWAPNLVVTVAPPTPTSITPNQAAATATTIPLSWAGTQGEYFRVLRKAGSYPTSATDGAATLVYEGNLTIGTATGLTAGTTYYFAAYGKSPVATSYSASAAQATAGTIPANPTGLTATPVSSTEVNLSWTGTSAEFIVLRKSDSYPATTSDGTVVHTGAGTSKLDTGLSAGTQYFYRVWGKTAGSSAFSAANSQATATTLIMPTDRFVNAASGNDQSGTNTCSDSGSPCRTITRAMTASGSGDVIYVSPGTYNIALGEVFPIIFKSGVQLLATGNPSNTIIDAAGDTVKDGIMRSTGNTSPNARIEGFTFTNGLKTPAAGCDSPLGGAVYINASTGTFTITRNAFVSNEVRGWSANGVIGGETGCLAWGGGIAVFGSTVNITNNTFSGNVARGGNGFPDASSPLSGNEYGGQGQGGAIYMSGSGNITNNTFRSNMAVGGNGGVASNGTGDGGPASGGAVMATGTPAPSVVNNIFSANAANSGTGGTPQPALSGSMFASVSAPLVSNNLFFDNTINGAASVGDTLGTASVLLAPGMHFPPGNLRLRNSSPAKGAGTPTGAPATDHDGTTRPNPPSIGAFEASIVVSSTALASGANPSNPGQFVTFTATVTGLGIAPTGTVTFKDGATAICSSVGLASGTAQCVTSALAAGSHSMTAEYSGDGNHSASTSPVVSQVVNNPNPARLLNISTRMQVLTGADVMIGGFVINGATNKTVAIVATGPSLAAYGITNPLANPTITLVRSSDQVAIASNNDWGTAANASALQAAGFAPTNPLEAAILVNLAPGAYTAIVEGVGGGIGVAVVAVYEVDEVTTPLVNISTRGRVQTGGDVMIGGFVITGSGPQTVAIVATGPSLAAYGIVNPLPNPTITLVRSSDGVAIDNNDDWGTHANASVLQSAGYAPTHPLESGIYTTLQPGAYTVIVSGVGGTTGVGVIGVYRMN